MPKFSILIPSYNRPEYLPKTVASILLSDFKDFELLVSDDASPKRVEIQLCLDQFKNDPRLVFIQQETNIGEARSRDFLMERAKGSFLIIIGDDDLLAPRALSRLKEKIEDQPDFDLYLFGHSIIDEHDRVYESRRALKPMILELKNKLLTQDLFSADLHPFWLYHPATFCFPKSLYRDIKPNHTVGIGDDLMFLYDAIIAGKRALVIPDILFSYRKFNISGSNYGQTNLSGKPLANVLTRRNILYVLLGYKNLPSSIKDFIYSRKFRERFLYESIVTDPNVGVETLPVLDLAPEHLAEFKTYVRLRNFRLFRRYLLILRGMKYVRYFGFPALFELFNIFASRRKYRSLISSI
jgi:glycosyltransferase involved in cell wall biosynthesis